MSTSIIVSVVFYRVVTVLCGLAFAFLGFRLFCLGVSEKAGELQATFGNRGLLLRQMAPGIYFALFGTIIVGISVYRGVDFTTEQSLAGAASSVTEHREDLAADGVSEDSRSSAVGELLGIDPQIDLDNMPRRLLSIIEKMQVDGEDALDNQERQLLSVWMGKLKARVKASNVGPES